MRSSQQSQTRPSQTRPSQFKFYQSYIDLIIAEQTYTKNIDKLRDEYDLRNLPEEQKKDLCRQYPYLKLFYKRPYMSNSSFRQHLLEHNQPSPVLVKELGPYLRGAMIRPQEVCIDTDDYYVAIDQMTTTAYICYKNLLMIDIDFYKEGQTRTEAELLEQLQHYCNKGHHGRQGHTFAIYRTRNGLHAFLISERADYNKDKYLQMMLDNGCDFFYVVYSYLRGWSVRLNKKEADLNDVYEKIGYVGNGPRDPHLEKLVALHLNIIKKGVFANIGQSLMYGG